jgi:hypothetical protein
VALPPAGKQARVKLWRDVQTFYSDVHVLLQAAKVGDISILPIAFTNNDTRIDINAHPFPGKPRYASKVQTCTSTKQEHRLGTNRRQAPPQGTKVGGGGGVAGAGGLGWGSGIQVAQAPSPLRLSRFSLPKKPTMNPSENEKGVPLFCPQGPYAKFALELKPNCVIDPSSLPNMPVIRSPGARDISTAIPPLM